MGSQGHIFEYRGNFGTLQYLGLLPARLHRWVSTLPPQVLQHIVSWRSSHCVDLLHSM